MIPTALKIIIPGGTGQLGFVLSRHLRGQGHSVKILGRKANHHDVIEWNGKDLGPWCQEIDGADVVINLAGRTVNCRYTKENLKQMMDSRVDSTRVVGEAIAQAKNPPKTWLQMSTATIYAHRFDAANDEETGIMGGNEPGVPGYWKYSIDIAKAWEETQRIAVTPYTRKVALRSAMVMTPDRGGVFDVLLGLTRWGLGGSIAGGRQYVSWIHEKDFVNAVLFLIAQENLSGPVNLAAPIPLPQGELMQELRAAWGISFGLPMPKWMAEIGAFFLRTDTELTLKSRRVVPKRLMDHGFPFSFPRWHEAVIDLISKFKNGGS